MDTNERGQSEKLEFGKLSAEIGKGGTTRPRTTYLRTKVWRTFRRQERGQPCPPVQTDVEKRADSAVCAPQRGSAADIFSASALSNSASFCFHSAAWAAGGFVELHQALEGFFQARSADDRNLELALLHACVTGQQQGLGWGQPVDCSHPATSLIIAPAVVTSDRSTGAPRPMPTRRCPDPTKMDPCAV